MGLQAAEAPSSESTSSSTLKPKPSTFCAVSAICPHHREALVLKILLYCSSSAGWEIDFNHH